MASVFDILMLLSSSFGVVFLSSSSSYDYGFYLLVSPKAVRPAVLMFPARWCRRCTCAVPDAFRHGRVANEFFDRNVAGGALMGFSWIPMISSVEL